MSNENTNPETPQEETCPEVTPEFQLSVNAQAKVANMEEFSVGNFKVSGLKSLKEQEYSSFEFEVKKV